MIGEIVTYYASTVYQTKTDGTHENIRKYYSFGNTTIAMRENGVVTWQLTDQINSTTVTASEDGTLTSEIKYTAFGETRYTSANDTPSDRLYTGQRLEEEAGLYYYVARFYDAELAHFIQADTVVPQPGNLLSYDRYAYVYNNPVNYADPSGHFKEKQLKKWFGKGWRKLFTGGWQSILLMAEFGDAIVHGDRTAVFVLSNNLLTGWDVNERNEISIQQLATGSGKLALYRSQNANQGGGASEFTDGATFGEYINPYSETFRQSNVYLRIMGDPENTPASITLPEGWYSGKNSYVQVTSYFAGVKLDIGNIVSGVISVGSVWGGLKVAEEITGKVLLKGLGGPAAVISLTVDGVLCTRWDTAYSIGSGQGPMPISPVPAPAPISTQPVN